VSGEREIGGGPIADDLVTRRPWPRTATASRATDVGCELPAIIRSGDVGSDVVRSRVRRGEIERLRVGVYRMPETASTPARDRERRVLALIAAVNATPRAPFWFSHESAALVWGCSTWHLAERVHLRRLTRPHVRSHDVTVVQHWASVPVEQRTAIHDVPVTSLERTAFDCARTLTTDRALVIADSALALGASRRVLDAMLVTGTGKRGVRRARWVVEHADARAESPGETLARWSVVAEGLPAPELQLEIETASGRYRADMGWREWWLLLEFDGEVKYRALADGDPSAVVMAEKWRQDALEELGWKVLRVSWGDLRDPTALAERVRRAAARTWRPR